MQEEKPELDIEAKVKDSLAINEEDINNEMANQPSQYFFWGVVWARAAKVKRTSKVQKQELEARLTKEFREMMAEKSPGERVTENMIKMYLGGHPDMQEAERKLVINEFNEDILLTAKEAMKQRHQALIELIRLRDEEKFYGDEYRRMREEMERQETKPKKIRKARTTDAADEE